MKNLISFIVSFLCLTTFAQTQLPSIPTVSGSSYSGVPTGVYALAVDASNNVYVGGNFSTVTSNGTPVSRKGIFRINADGTINSWNPYNVFTDIHIITMTISGNKLFVAGESTTQNTTTFKVFDISSSNPSPVSVGGAWVLGFDGLVSKLYAASNGYLYVMGSFTNVLFTSSSVPRNNFATFNLNATSTNNVLVTSGFLPTFDATVFGSMAYDATSNVLYVAGSFSTVNGVSKSGVVGLNASNGSLTSFNHTFTYNIGGGAFYEGMTINNGNLYVAGSFVKVDGNNYVNAASFTLPSGTLRSWNINNTTAIPSGNGMTSVSIANDYVALGGNFNSINGTTRNNFAIVSATDASLYSYTSSNTAGSVYVNALTPIINNQILVGGAFSGGLELVSLKQNQTISFGPLSPVTYSPGGSFTVSASATSGLGVTFTSDNLSVATVTGTTVNIIGAGSCNIIASQSGNATYNAAPNVSQLLTVNKANQTITFNPLTPVTYGDPNFTVSASTTSGLSITFSSSNSSIASVSGTSVTVGNAGSSKITATQAGNSNYNSASVSQLLTVNKANQTITFNPLTPVTYGDAPFNISASTTSGLSITFSSSNSSIANILGTQVTVGNAGSSNITATQAGNSNYNSASVSQLLTVNKANQTITFAPLADVTQGDPDVTYSASSSVGLPITFSSDNVSVITISGNTGIIGNGGDALITATSAGNSNYNSASVSQNQHVVSTKTAQTITFNSLSPVTYGNAPFNISASTTSGLNVTFTSDNTSVATVVGTQVTIVGAGVCNIIASQSGNATFDAAPNVSRPLTVNKADQSITFDVLPLTLSLGDNYTLPLNSSAGLAITYFVQNTNIVSVSGNILTVINYGSTTITASQDGNANYNTANGVNQDVFIKRSQTITFDAMPQDKIVGDIIVMNVSSDSGLEVTLTSSNTSIGQIVAGNKLKLVGQGTVTVTASQSGNDAFKAAPNVSQSALVNSIITAVVNVEQPTLTAYPNPTTDVIHVQTVSQKNKTVLIYSVNGQLMDQLTTTEAEVTFNVASYQTGIYVVKISDTDNSASLKFIKQ